MKFNATVWEKDEKSCERMERGKLAGPLTSSINIKPLHRDTPVICAFFKSPTKCRSKRRPSRSIQKRARPRLLCARSGRCPAARPFERRLSAERWRLGFNARLPIPPTRRKEVEHQSRSALRRAMRTGRGADLCRSLSPSCDTSNCPPPFLPPSRAPAVAGCVVITIRGGQR